MTSRIGSWPRIVLGLLIGGGAFYLAIRHVDWHRVAVSLRQTRPDMLLASFLCVCIAITLSAIRWRLLFAAEHRHASLPALAGAILVGQTLNIAMPGRVGEVARVMLIAGRERMSKAHVAATLVVEKVADLGVFAVAIASLLLGISLPDWLAKSGVATLILSAFLVATTVALTFFSDALLRFVERLALYLPESWRGRVVRVVEKALDGLRSLRSWRTGLAIWLLSAVILALSIATNYFVLAAMRLSPTVVMAVFLTVVMRVGAAPPSLPGRLGLFQYLVVVALAVFGIDKTTALTSSFVLYATAVIPILIAGAIASVSFRWSES